MKQFLTPEEKGWLEGVHRELRYSQEADKIKAILLLNAGYSREEVARILLRDVRTITRWKNDFMRKVDLASWAEDKREGYSGKLSMNELKVLERYVEENLITDAKEVQQWIIQTFGIAYTIAGVHAILHRLGFVYKQTTAYPSKADPVEHADFKEFHDDLRENLGNNEILLYMDGVHPQHNTSPTKAWIKQGKQKPVPTNTGRKRLNINGAYNPENQEIIYRCEETINGAATIKLFKQIEQHYQYASTIYIVRDNARYYFNQEVEAYLQNSRIEVIPLPTYSPNLNLIERFWKFLKKKVIKTHYYEKFADFKNAVLGFLDNAHFYQAELKRFVGTELHLLPYLTA